MDNNNNNNNNSGQALPLRLEATPERMAPMGQQTSLDKRPTPMVALDNSSSNNSKNEVQMVNIRIHMLVQGHTQLEIPFGQASCGLSLLLSSHLFRFDEARRS